MSQFKFKILVIGTGAVATAAKTRVKVLGDIDIADIEMAHVTTVREATKELAEEHIFFAVFMEGADQSGLGQIRSTGFNGVIATIGNTTISKADESFFEVTRHDTVNQAFCLLLRGLAADGDCPVYDCDARGDTDGIPVNVSHDVVAALPMALAQ